MSEPHLPAAVADNSCHDQLCNLEIFHLMNELSRDGIGQPEFSSPLMPSRSPLVWQDLWPLKGQELDVCCYDGLYFSPSATCSFYPLWQVAAVITCWSLMGCEELGLGSPSLIPSSQGVHSTMLLQALQGT